MKSDYESVPDLTILQRRVCLYGVDVGRIFFFLCKS